MIPIWYHIDRHTYLLLCLIISSWQFIKFNLASFEPCCSWPHSAVILCRTRDQTTGFPHFPGKPYTMKRCFLAASLLYINGCTGSAIPLRGAWTSLLKWLTCGRQFKQPVCTLTSHFRRWRLKKEGKEGEMGGGEVIFLSAAVPNRRPTLYFIQQCQVGSWLLRIVLGPACSTVHQGRMDEK